MHVTLRVFLLILVLSRMPQLQAIRFKETLLQASKQMLNAPKSAYKNNNQTSAGGALGLAISLYLSASYAYAHENEQKINPPEEPPFDIKGLDLKNPQAVIEALEKAPDAEKELLAKKLAHHIAWYWHDVSYYTIEDISTFLQHATHKSHRILITALSKNITRFTTEDITRILKADNQEETHAFIAQALKDNYTALTSYSFCGVPLTSNNHWRRQYAALLKVLQPKHQGKVLQPILENIQDYNVFDLLYFAHNEHKQTILKALQEAASINLSIYNGCQLYHLLELTKDLNQTIVAQAIARAIDTYNSWHFHGMFKVCTEESKKIILKAIAERLHKNIERYDSSTLSILEEMACELPEEASSTHIVKTINARNAAQQSKLLQEKNKGN